jgi:hypothetical protein
VKRSSSINQTIDSAFDKKPIHLTACLKTTKKQTQTKRTNTPKIIQNSTTADIIKIVDVAQQFFATFQLISRDCPHNNALKDNSGLIFRFVVLICYVFGNTAYMFSLLFLVQGEKRGRREGFHTSFEGKERIMQIKTGGVKFKMTQKTTDEIRTLLSNAKLDFDSVENRALNEYLPKIFRSCPFTGDICETKQCLECAVFNKLPK